MPTPKIRHDWYQTESHVIVTILAKNSDNVKVVHNERTVSKIIFYQIFRQLFIVKINYRPPKNVV